MLSVIWQDVALRDVVQQQMYKQSGPVTLARLGHADAVRRHPEWFKDDIRRCLIAATLAQQYDTVVALADTFPGFNLTYSINIASCNNDTKLLDLLYKKYSSRVCSLHVVSRALAHNNIAVLQWAEQHKLAVASQDMYQLHHTGQKFRQAYKLVRSILSKRIPPPVRVRSIFHPRPRRMKKACPFCRFPNHSVFFCSLQDRKH